MSEPVNLDERVSYWRRKYEATKEELWLEKEKVQGALSLQRSYAGIAERRTAEHSEAIDALIRVRKEREALEEALAVSADELLTYKDYYGTSPAQVKHLAECTKCLPLECMSDERCPDYPSE